MNGNTGSDLINRKIQLFFVLILFISIILSAGYSYYEYSKLKFVPKYNTAVIKEKNFDINNIYLVNYEKEFIFKNAILILLKNLFLLSLIFNTFCFSLVIRNTDILRADGKKMEFSKIVSHGLYILIGLTLLYLLSLELINPMLENRLEFLRNNSTRACTSLMKGNEYYINKDYKNSMFYYNDYLRIVNYDKVIFDRNRELERLVKVNESKNMAPAGNEDTTIPDNITDFIKLGDFYYQKKDYNTALYFYEMTANTNDPKKNEAAEKVESIKKIFKYENSMKDENERLSDKALSESIDKVDSDIQGIYKLKLKAGIYLKNKDFLNAYFVYADILKINPNLRDVIQSQNDAFIELIKIGAELSDLEKAKIYPGKKDFAFMLTRNQFIYFGNITVGIDTFYLYNIKIYNLNDSFKIISTIEAPYGQTKALNDFTLFCFSKDDRKISYMPVMKSAGKQEASKEYIFMLPADMNILYNFSYDYKRTFGFSLINLFKLKNIAENDSRLNYSVGFNAKYIKTAILEKISLVFLFFSVNLIFISIAWRFRSNYIGNISFFNLILITVIPVFLYFLSNILQIFETSFYTMISDLANFSLILVICFTLNSILTFFSIIYIASSK